MKQLFLVLLTVFTLSLAVSAQKTIDLNINGVEIETTEAEAIQKLGKPSSRKKFEGDECQGSLLRLLYSGLILELEDGKSNEKIVVATATVTSPKWSFSGIYIGASVSEVKKKFGDSKSERKKGLDYLSYIIGDGYADFVFQKGKLVKIHWEFNFC